jgi:hypothetical protein
MDASPNDDMELEVCMCGACRWLSTEGRDEPGLGPQAPFLIRGDASLDARSTLGAGICGTSDMP